MFGVSGTVPLRRTIDCLGISCGQPQYTSPLQQTLRSAVFKPSAMRSCHYHPQCYETHVLFANSKEYCICSRYLDGITMSQGSHWEDLRLLRWSIEQIQSARQTADQRLKPTIVKSPKDNESHRVAKYVCQPYNFEDSGVLWHGIPLQLGWSSRKSLVLVAQACSRTRSEIQKAIIKIENRVAGRNNHSEAEILQKLEGIPGVVRWPVIIFRRCKFPMARAQKREFAIVS